jgi:hypothetical protein
VWVLLADRAIPEQGRKEAHSERQRRGVNTTWSLSLQQLDPSSSRFLRRRKKKEEKPQIRRPLWGEESSWVDMASHNPRGSAKSFPPLEKGVLVKIQSVGVHGLLAHVRAERCPDSYMFRFTRMKVSPSQAICLGGWVGLQNSEDPCQEQKHPILE